MDPPEATATYRFRSPEEGGRQQLPSADYRADWRYADEPGRQVWSVHKVFRGADRVVPGEGLVELRFHDRAALASHAGRLRPGVRGYLVEGGQVTADLVVVEVAADLC